DVQCGGGLPGRVWLDNFGCNPLEWFANYNIKFSNRYVKSLQSQVQKLPKEIAQLEKKKNNLSQTDSSYQKVRKSISKKKEVLKEKKRELRKWSSENFEKLSPMQKNLYHRAFTINSDNPEYHELTT